MGIDVVSEKVLSDFGWKGKNQACQLSYRSDRQYMAMFSRVSLKIDSLGDIGVGEE